MRRRFMWRFAFGAIGCLLVLGLIVGVTAWLVGRLLYGTAPMLLSALFP